MEHLIYVLWHDHWKPWIVNKLQLAGYVALGVLLTATICVGMIWTELQVEQVLNGFYGG